MDINKEHNKDITIFKSSSLLKMTNEKKQEFIDKYRDTPNIGKVARSMGVNRRTVHTHLQRDEAFKMALEDVRQSHVDDAEELLIQTARGEHKMGQNFLPTIAYLKAHRSKYKDSIKHEHKHDHEVIDDLYAKIPKNKIIDAQVVGEK